MRLVQFFMYSALGLASISGASTRAAGAQDRVNTNAGASNIEQDKAHRTADRPPVLLRQLTVVPASEDKPRIPGAVVKSGSVLNSNPTQHVSLLEMQETKPTAEQEEQLALIPRRTRERLTEIQRNGGWQKVFSAQLTKARQQGVPMNEKLTAPAQAFLEEFARCQRPAIADAISEFAVLARDARFDTVPLDMDLVIEPFALVLIDGCLFGNDAGEVRLLLKGAPGGFIAVSNGSVFWSDTSIATYMPLAPGFPDQPAQLVVIRKDGTATAPFPVQFVQRRVMARFDPASHLGSAGSTSTALTSYDQLDVVQLAGNPPFSDFTATHWTLCCDVVTGTDRWLMKLKNGWHVPVAGETVILPKHFAAQPYNLAFAFFEADAPEFNKDDGLSTCGLFSSWPGWIMSTSLNTPTDFPQFQQEFDVTWKAGSNCSGIAYQVGLYIVGPEGLPYD